MPHTTAFDNERTLKTLCRTMRLTSNRRFELILVHCNYQKLQQEMLEKLYETCPLSIEELELSRTDQTLYTLIEKSYKNSCPEALCVYGFEVVEDLETLLLATNQVREEFRKNFKFPLVLWLNDEVLKKFIRLVPDFYSWATPLSFDRSNEELVELIKSSSDILFEHAFNASERYPASETVLRFAVKAPRLQELKTAQSQLEERNYQLDRELRASIELALGRDHYRHDRLEEAEASYQQSFSYWESTQQVERAAIVLFHLGLCYRRKSYAARSIVDNFLIDAKQCFEHCLESLEAEQSYRLASHFIGQLGEVLQEQKDWALLQSLTKKSLKLHQEFQNPARLARDWGFLASIDINNTNWKSAYVNAREALNALAKAPESDQQRQGLYLWLLAQAQRNLGEIEEAISSLEDAKQTSQIQHDPLTYIEILKALRELYFQKNQYLKAFGIKQEQQAVESQYGYRAFIGASRLRPLRHIKPALMANEPSESIAQELSVTVRSKDITSLLERLARSHYKLTIVHGQSGVGKSSMMSAGLVPALKGRIMNSRDVVPVYCQFYGNWVEHLCHSMTNSLISYPDALQKNLTSSLDVLHQIRRNDTQNLLTILIFDQFEEFFINCETPKKRKPFFDFLNQCFQLPFVKVLLVLREDYLHYLLEYERISSNTSVSKNILKDSNRFELINFSKEDTKEIINSLAERSNISWEPELVDEVVHDLAQEQGTVRPIELQIVGAQLQTKQINTLASYQKNGPKDKLVQRYLETVVEDCGAENKQVSDLVLYLLTGDNDTRPQRTREEIKRELKQLANDVIQEERLDLMLDIFVKSGLVFSLPGTPSNRYQLAHDYLANFIRSQQQPKINARIAHLEQEKDRLTQVNLELEQTNLELNKERKQREKTQKNLETAARNNRRGRIVLLTSAVLFSIALVVATIFGLKLRQFSQELTATEADLENSQDKFNIQKESWEVWNEFEAEQLSGLMGAIKLGSTYQEIAKTEKLDLNFKNPVLVLQKILMNIRLKNQFFSHEDEVYTVAFSPNDSRYLLTGSKDKIAWLWDLNSKIGTPLEGHKDAILDVDFSPNGKFLLTASADETVRLWNYDGKEVKTCEIGFPIYTGQFNPSISNLFAIASDKIQILDDSCNVVEEVDNPSSFPLLSLAFSPDGNTLVVGSADSMISIWELREKKLILQEKFSGHSSSVNDIAFSSNGQIFATVSNKGIGKIWGLNGELQDEFKNSAPMRSVAFFSDTQNTERIITASDDGTVGLWNVLGERVFQFSGHQKIIRDVSFNTNSNDPMVATVSDDKIVRIWSLKRKLLPHHEIPEITRDSSIDQSSMSADQKFLVAASDKGFAYVWDRENNHFGVLKIHPGERILDIEFHPKKHIFATLTNFGQIKLWDLQGNLFEDISPGNTQAEQQDSGTLAFSSTGDRIAVSQQGGNLAIFNWENNTTQLLPSQNQNNIFNIEFTLDNRYLVTSGANGKICIHDLSLQNDPRCLPEEKPIIRAILSSDNRTLVTADLTGNITIRDIWNLEIEPKEFRAGTQLINDIAFNSDNTLLAIAAEALVQIWTIEGQPMAEFRGHKDAVRNVYFTHNSQGGNILLSLSRDGHIQPWNIDISITSLLNSACEWGADYLGVRKNSSNRREQEEAEIVNQLCENLEP